MILDYCHFIYGTFDSADYGLIFAHCDTSEYKNLMGEFDTTKFFNKRDKSASIIGDDFKDSPVTISAEIVTDDYEPLDSQRMRAVEKALFNKRGYAKLFANTEDDVDGSTYEYIGGDLKRLYLNCRFINPERIQDGGGRTIGYKFDIECDSCMAWQEVSRVASTFSGTTTSSVSQMSVVTDTDIGDFTYPDIVVRMGSSGGDLTIINHSDDSTRLTKFVGLSPNVNVIIRGNHNFISGDNYYKFQNQNFPRLIDGTNNISITGNVELVQFRWQNRRFL